MGKKWKRFCARPKRERSQTNYVQIARENASFEKYYKAQQLVPENEWSEFMSCLRTDLPAVFRLTGGNGGKSQSRALLKVLHEKFFIPLLKKNILNEKSELEEVKTDFSCHALPWYPDNLGWQLSLSRKDIRNNKLFWELQQFLITETDTGNISRQEAVSMIPPLVLDVKSHHKILDMCASPGSKTAQIIEYLHNSADNLAPEGIIIANDLDNRRCYMLTHQTGRLQSEAIMVTNHDAAFMPKISHTRKDGSIGQIKFDRILCDVPCSGDGTLRKNFDVWGKWQIMMGTNLHGLQLRIARRGIQMLAEGGRMVYSTCSMNPIENEAVINRLLEEFKDIITLVDVKDQLPGLKSVSGLSNWVVMNKDLEVMTPDQTDSSDTNKHYQHLFPPTYEEAENRNLNKCIRILPHHQNTGGFFIAVLEKTKTLSFKCSTEEDGCIESVDRTQRLRSPPAKIFRGYREQPFYYFNESNKFWPEISECFKMKESFDMTLLLRRAEDGKGRTIYYTNALVKDVITKNQDRIKIVSGGLKVFSRCDNLGALCNFRLSQDGINLMLLHMTHRKMTVQKNDLLLMLNCDDIVPPPISSLDPVTQKLCEDIETGSIAFIYEETGENGFLIQLAGWKGKNSLRCYLGKNIRIHYIRLLGGDTSNYDKKKFSEKNVVPTVPKTEMEDSLSTAS